MDPIEPQQIKQEEEQYPGQRRIKRVFDYISKAIKETIIEADLDDLRRPFQNVLLKKVEVLKEPLNNCQRKRQLVFGNKAREPKQIKSQGTWLKRSPTKQRLYKQQPRQLSTSPIQNAIAKDSAYLKSCCVNVDDETRTSHLKKFFAGIRRGSCFLLRSIFFWLIETQVLEDPTDPDFEKPSLNFTMIQEGIAEGRLAFKELNVFKQTLPQTYSILDEGFQNACILPDFETPGSFYIYGGLQQKRQASSHPLFQLKLLFSDDNAPYDAHLTRISFALLPKPVCSFSQTQPQNRKYIEKIGAWVLLDDDGDLHVFKPGQLGRQPQFAIYKNDLSS